MAIAILELRDVTFEKSSPISVESFQPTRNVRIQLGLGTAGDRVNCYLSGPQWVSKRRSLICTQQGSVVVLQPANENRHQNISSSRVLRPRTATSRCCLNLPGRSSHQSVVLPIVCLSYQECPENQKLLAAVPRCHRSLAKSVLCHQQQSALGFGSLH